MRILIRPRLPVLALLLLAPSIPELLTGSTPVSRLFVDPVGFAVSFGFDIGLYGTGALLIREAAVALRKGWASILLWGAAYGVAEEGLAVHTFFERSGPPVGALSVYGAGFGVNWLWALGLTIFHATYSIALPILLTRLWFPGASAQRWFDRPAIASVAVVYVVVVAVFAFLVGHGPSHALLALFLALEVVLLAAGWWVPANLLRARPGPGTFGRLGIALAGALEWIAWITVLILSSGPKATAWAAGGVVVGLNALALWVVVRGVSRHPLERAQFAFAVGMLVPLFVWDAILELGIPGILLVSALFGYLLYRLGRTIDGRALGPPTPVPPGAA